MKRDDRQNILFQQSAMSGTVSPMSAIGLPPVGDHFNILVWYKSATIYLIHGNQA